MRFAKIVFLILLAVILSGCVTTQKYKTDMDRMQTRITELESQIKQKEDVSAMLRENQLDLEKALKKQALQSQSLQDELNAAQRRLNEAQRRIESLAKAEGREKVQLKMPDAREIQAALKKANFYKGAIDGVIGPETKEAIRKFQEANQLTPDGIVGSRTWAILESLIQEK